MTPGGENSGERVGFWPIVPSPAPRQTSSDRWRTGRRARPCVARYHAFRDDCRLRKVWAPQPGDLLLFLMPIPPSRRGSLVSGTPHTQTPDLDNLCKALMDALYDNDSAIWTLTAAKVWSTMPGIVIRRPSSPLDSITRFQSLIATISQEDPCHATASR